LCIFRDLIICNAEFISWDVTRFSDRAKATRVKESGLEAAGDQSLPSYFHPADFGELIEPTIILDQHGNVMVWALPGVLHPNRLVRL
jgi:hypothetical protein